MSFLENRIPPPLVAALFALAMWLLAPSLPALDPATFPRPAICAALLAAGAFFCLAGVISFRRAKTTVNPLKPDTASALVDGGIYRVSRNPMYVGFAAFLAAWACWLSSPWLLAGVPLYMAWLTRFQILPEERALTRLFGDDYARYRARVRRWL